VKAKTRFGHESIVILPLARADRAAGFFVAISICSAISRSAGIDNAQNPRLSGSQENAQPVCRRSERTGAESSSGAGEKCCLRRARAARCDRADDRAVTEIVPPASTSIESGGGDIGVAVRIDDTVARQWWTFTGAHALADDAMIDLDFERLPVCSMEERWARAAGAIDA
jgi:hypothetical protein